MTVMTWGNSEGVKGRCDAKCHRATNEKCDCMCGGRYHGAGRTAGELDRRLREDGDKVLAAAEAAAKEQGFEIKTPARVLELFGQARLL